MNIKDLLVRLSEIPSKVKFQEYETKLSKIGDLTILNTTKKDNLVNSINETNNNCSAVKGRVDTLDRSVEGATNSINGLNRNIETINNNINTINSNANTLKGRVDTMQTNFNNSKPSYYEKQIISTSWNMGEYSFENEYPSSTYDIEIELSGNATKENAQKWAEAIPVPNSQGLNKLKALGTVPNINIPIRVKVVKK